MDAINTGVATLANASNRQTGVAIPFWLDITPVP